MLLFSMWERSVHYEQGWFIYVDGQRHCSVISEERARDLERGYVLYQASQDIDRGGSPREVAYTARGVIETTDANRQWRLELRSYAADFAIRSGQPVEMKGILTIPEKIDGFTIDMVYDSAFSGCTYLEKVNLPDTVTSIGEKAFYGCSSLKDVTIPKGLSKIGEKAFEGTLVKTGMTVSTPVQIMGHILVKADSQISGEYSVPAYVTSIADMAFAGCKALTEIIIHDNVASIGRSAFADCVSLTEIRMPKKVAHLGFGCFDGCGNLKEIIIPEGVTILNHFHRCEKLERVSIPSSVKSIDSNCFTGTALMNGFLEGKEETLTVDKWLIQYRVSDKNELVIEDGIIGIADQDWFKHSGRSEYSALKSVYLSRNLKYIGAHAFERTGITEVVLPEGLLSMAMSCFRGTPLKRITIPATVESIEQWAFMDCECLEEIVFLGDTKVVWPAITGRKDKTTITVCAAKDSHAYAYVNQYAKRYRLRFSEVKPENRRNIFGRLIR